MGSRTHNVNAIGSWSSKRRSCTQAIILRQFAMKCYQNTRSSQLAAVKKFLKKIVKNSLNFCCCGVRRPCRKNTGWVARNGGDGTDGQCRKREVQRSGWVLGFPASTWQRGSSPERPHKVPRAQRFAPHWLGGVRSEWVPPVHHIQWDSDRNEASWKFFSWFSCLRVGIHDGDTWLTATDRNYYSVATKCGKNTTKCQKSLTNQFRGIKKIVRCERFS